MRRLEHVGGAATLFERVDFANVKLPGEMALYRREIAETVQGFHGG